MLRCCRLCGLTSSFCLPLGPSISTPLVQVLQWGRDHVIAELAALLFYSVFKDLRARQRAPHHFTPKSPFQPDPRRP